MKSSALKVFKVGRKQLGLTLHIASSSNNMVT